MSATAPATAPPRLLLRVRRGVPGLRDTGVVGHACAAVIVLVALTAVFGAALAPKDPNAVHLSQSYFGPGDGYLLGQDGQGRDLLSRLLAGARTSIAGPLLIVVLSTVIGVALALVAAWRGGWLDSVTSRLADALFALPGVLLAVFAVAMFGTGLAAPVIALTVAYVPYTVRLIRAAALRERSLPYVDALIVQGTPTWTIAVRHLLPNLMALIVAQMTVGFGFALLDLAAVSYLGLGPQPPQADWGIMVYTGQDGLLQGYPAESLLAGGCIIVTVVAFNVLGDRLVERAEARL